VERSVRQLCALWHHLANEMKMLAAYCGAFFSYYNIGLSLSCVSLCDFSFLLSITAQ